MHARPSYLLRLLMLQALAIATARAGAQPVPFDGVLRTAADGSVYALLDPPFPGNHAASLEALPDGSLVVAFFTGGEGQPNCSIAVARLDPTSDRWTPGTLASRVTNQSSQNPVLFWDNDAQLLRLFHTSPASGEPSSLIYTTASSDGGRTWPPARPFYSLSGAFTRNRLLPLAEPPGALLFPLYYSAPGNESDYPFALLSPAAGAGAPADQWQAVTMPRDDLIQPTIVRLPQVGTNSTFLRAWLRDEDQVCARVSDSYDEGRTWTWPAQTALWNNNAALQATVLENGALVVAFDNATGPTSPRSPLILALSYDHGVTWPASRALQVHEDNSTNVPEFSYPTLLQLNMATGGGAGAMRGDIHVAFTYGRETIKYVRVSEQWILQGP